MKFELLRRWLGIEAPAEIEAGPPISVSEALLADRPSDVFVRWARQGRLGEILPDLEALRGITQLPAHHDDAFVHTLKVVDAIAPTPVRRWAALLHDIGKAATFIETPEGRSRFFEHDRIGAEMVPEIMTAAGADPELIEPVTRLVRLHMRPISYTPEWTDAAVRRLAEEVEEGRKDVGSGWDDLLALARADLHGYLPEPIARGLWTLDALDAHRKRIMESELAEARRSEATMAREPASPLDGNEILALTARQPGPWVGELKTYLRDKVAAGELPPGDKDRATRLARAWLDNRTEG